MLKTVSVLLAVIAVVFGFCNNDAGSWGYGAATQAYDFASAGVAPNDKYYCWQACFNTLLVHQNFKVKLANPLAPKFPRRILSPEQIISFADNDQNGSCIDPILQAEVEEALLKTTNYSTAAIARTLQYQIGRPGWIYNVLDATGAHLTINDIYSDMNFCLYFSNLSNRRYIIHVVAIDMS